MTSFTKYQGAFHNIPVPPTQLETTLVRALLCNVFFHVTNSSSVYVPNSYPGLVVTLPLSTSSRDDYSMGRCLPGREYHHGNPNMG